MNTNISTSAGLNVYRELINRESAGNAHWHQEFGIEAQMKELDPQKLVTLGGFQAAVSVPLPLTLQLFALQKERRKTLREGRQMEEKMQPFLSPIPISQPSVDIFGEKAYTQRPNSTPSSDGRPVTSVGMIRALQGRTGPPHSRGKANVVDPVRLTKRYNIDGTYFNREQVGPAHLRRRRPQSAAPFY